MKKIAYYHVYLTDDPGIWINMLLEQFKCMEDSDLLNNLDAFNISCITKRDSRVEHFNEFVRLYYSNVNIDFYENPFSSDEEMMHNVNAWDRGHNVNMPTENITKRKIYQHAFNEDAYILYFHTKGITSIMKHLKSGEMHFLRKYQYWRYYLNWGVLENWSACVNGLQTCDVAGVNFMLEPSPHFSGNFWWSKSEHIRKLPDPSTVDWFKTLQSRSTNHWFRNASLRFRDEQWICSIPDTKVFKLVDTKSDKNPANVYTPRSQYYG